MQMNEWIKLVWWFWWCVKGVGLTLTLCAVFWFCMTWKGLNGRAARWSLSLALTFLTRPLSYSTSHSSLSYLFFCSSGALFSVNCCCCAWFSAPSQWLTVLLLFAIYKKKKKKKGKEKEGRKKYTESSTTTWPLFVCMWMCVCVYVCVCVCISS